MDFKFVSFHNRLDSELFKKITANSQIIFIQE